MKQLTINKILVWVWALLWFFLPVSMKGTVVILWLFGLLVIISTFLHKPKTDFSQLPNLVLFTLLLAWFATSFLLGSDPDKVWIFFERKVSLLIIPALLFLVFQQKIQMEKWAIRGLFLGLSVTGIHMLLNAMVRTSETPDPDIWMYHEFTSPYALGAVYYSWYLSAALIYLAFPLKDTLIVKTRTALLGFFTFLLLLSASKLFILLTIPLLIARLFFSKDSFKYRKQLGVIMILLVLIGSFPILNRIGDLKKTDLELVKQEEFSYDTPFNGITIRLVQWRFGLEILEEHRAWTLGVGLHEKQVLLNEYYRKHGVYTGNPDLGDTGYLNYNYHNQYMETLVGSGIPGLLVLLILIAYIIVRGYGRRLIFPWPVYLILALFFVTESVLERQSGIMFFCLIACTFADIQEDPLQINESH